MTNNVNRIESESKLNSLDDFNYHAIEYDLVVPPRR